MRIGWYDDAPRGLLGLTDRVSLEVKLHANAPLFVTAHELLHVASALYSPSEPAGEEALIRSLTPALERLLKQARKIG